MELIDLKQNAKYHIFKNIFKSVSEDDINDLLRISTIKKYQKNEIILNKNIDENALYILMEGIIKIGYLNPNGRLHTFLYFSDKKPINLVNCFISQGVEYDYYAFNQVSIISIPKQQFLEKVENNEGFKNACFEIMSLRMKYMSYQIKFLNVANLHQKICKTLIDLNSNYGIKHAIGSEILLKLSQNDFADLISSSRQTINKEIKNLVNLNVIQWQYESIIIRDLDYLKKQIEWI